MKLKTASLLALFGNLVALVMFILANFNLIPFDYQTEAGRTFIGLYYSLASLMSLGSISLFFASLYLKQE
jgi:hypothetical protein